MCNSALGYSPAWSWPFNIKNISLHEENTWSDSTNVFYSHTSSLLTRNVDLRHITWDFPGGTVDRNPPANAGDRGSSPSPGRFHMLWATKAYAPQLLESVSSRACEPQLMNPCATITEACAPQQEKPPQQETWAPQLRVAPACSLQLEKAWAQQWRPSTAKNTIINIFN